METGYVKYMLKQEGLLGELLEQRIFVHILVQ